jgi:queuine/archaeosine tRNA-ribosyltransferase
MSCFYPQREEQHSFVRREVFEGSSLAGVASGEKYAEIGNIIRNTTEYA